MAPKKPPLTHKATPSAIQTRQKIKKVISTSALFAQIPKLKAAPASRHVPTTKYLQPQKLVAVVIPKKGPEHSLLNEFNETTKTYTTDLLSEASTKLLSTHDTLINRLNAATPENLLTPTERHLRSQLTKPIPLPPAISSLTTILTQIQQTLSTLHQDYTTLTTQISSLVSEIMYTHPTRSNSSKPQLSHNADKNVPPKRHLDESLITEIHALEREINALGDEEIKEMEKERRVEEKKREKIARFFQALDEDE